MTPFQWLVILRWVTVIFGSGYLRRLILFECKYLFAIYVNIWKTIEHDRFHTHAFSSISFMLMGEYDEERLHENGTIERKTIRAPYIRYISRSNNHRMLEARGRTVSVTIAGPWDRIWSETLLTGEKRFLTWGRKVLNER